MWRALVGILCVVWLSGFVSGKDEPTQGKGDLIKDSDAAPPPVAQPGRKKGEKTQRLKFTVATPEEAAAAMQRVRDQEEKISSKLKLTFVSFETDHFIVFTDWDSREHNFLKKNLEQAYKVVSRQFDMSVKENVFVGKLPVYMFTHYGDFSRFASTVDNFTTNRSVAGYFRGMPDGAGHMAMWKPDASMTGSNNIKDAERLWGYVLVHEFTHAFLSRYRTNEVIPRWLNEGIAEVVAASVFPYPDRYRIAKLMAHQSPDLMPLFDDEVMPPGIYYPVMQTMVESLVETDRKKFLAMIDDIKDGVDPEDAMRKHFKTNYAGFSEAWRAWAKKREVR